MFSGRFPADERRRLFSLVKEAFRGNTNWHGTCRCSVAHESYRVTPCLPFHMSWVFLLPSKSCSASYILSWMKWGVYGLPWPLR
ncbi:hypothetical protein CPSG_05504 [Coccidioides posadasii str. Silveira]|uniref:Uncharacterized protein n=1 Tax=Coccidioides posadasii (strain RMSCC 757 / Silveira) TaxID=443226 RepID=E9D6J5_COCPS|nr:hypothetical protein CPSG_05504 [Coccidioides posadasii str. Silveira]